AARAGDIVVTQDIGLAAMVLGRGAFAVNPRGEEYTTLAIDAMLTLRHAAAKIRRAGGRTRGPKKRTVADRDALAATLTRLCTGARTPAAVLPAPSPPLADAGRDGENP
ncbi:MAG TPA: DUF188 domain-containing protein, partial [bacterium]|nr:DUF188 domain-containing protein [bacterium]